MVGIIFKKLIVLSVFKVREGRDIRDIWTFKDDEIVKSHKTRHSRESGSLQQIDFTGFPLSRE